MTLVRTKRQHQTPRLFADTLLVYTPYPHIGLVTTAAYLTSAKRSLKQKSASTDGSASVRRRAARAHNADNKRVSKLLQEVRRLAMGGSTGYDDGNGDTAYYGKKGGASGGGGGGSGSGASGGIVAPAGRDSSRSPTLLPIVAPGPALSPSGPAAARGAGLAALLGQGHNLSRTAPGPLGSAHAKSTSALPRADRHGSVGDVGDAGVGSPQQPKLAGGRASTAEARVGRSPGRRRRGGDGSRSRSRSKAKPGDDDDDGDGTPSR